VNEEELNKQIDDITQKYEEELENMDEEERQEYTKHLQNLNNVTDSTITNAVKSMERTPWETIKSYIPFIKTGKLRMGIITYGGQIEWSQQQINGQFIEKDEQSYLIDLKQVLFSQGKPTLMYYEGNPFPIDFYSQHRKPIVSTESLYKAFNNKITEDLFSTGGLSTATKWTFGVIFGILVAFLVIWQVVQNSGVIG
jgi:hypothetical protein